MKNKKLLIVILALVLLGAHVVAAETSDIYIIRIADAISPGTSEFIK